MSRPVPELFEELAMDVEQVRLAPAATVRARGLRRARRRLAGTAAAVTAVAALAGFGLVARGGAPDTVDMPATWSSTGCVAPPDLSLPDSPEAVQVRLLPGRSTRTASSMIQQLAGGQPAGDGSAPKAVLRYGPSAVGAATLVRALFAAEVVMDFQPRREGSVVDVELSAGFHSVATPTEMNQALVEYGEPTAPPQCG